MISSVLLAIFSDGTPAAMCIIIAIFILCAAAMAFLSEPDGASKNFHSTTKIRSKS